jgi:phage gp46-like protein
MDARLAPAEDHVDLAIEAGDLEHDDGLWTAIVISLFSDARGPLDPEVPLLEQQLRGWWAEAPHDDYGSLLWTLARSKQTTDTLSRAREHARDALEWLVTDEIASAIGVSAEWVDRGILGLGVTITRGTSRRWAHLWRAMDGSSPTSRSFGRVTLRLSWS